MSLKYVQNVQFFVFDCHQQWETTKILGLDANMSSFWILPKTLPLISFWSSSVFFPSILPSIVVLRREPPLIIRHNCNQLNINIRQCICLDTVLPRKLDTGTAHLQNPGCQRFTLIQRRRVRQLLLLHQLTYDPSRHGCPARGNDEANTRMTASIHHSSTSVNQETHQKPIHTKKKETETFS